LLRLEVFLHSRKNLRPARTGSERENLRDSTPLAPTQNEMLTRTT
jgi:hypothetical protein